MDPDPNTICILVATDLHLGYNETDAIRGEDSFNTFEEILQLAVEHDVDFVLLGGDLFHDAKPSPPCLLKCSTILRKYCFGNKPVQFEILSDQKENFKESITQSVNYEDPNINISYPVFSIHGNHDDPIGKGAVSSLDILSRMGLVNYFGKWTDYSEITVSPILLKKGETKLALYGLSFLKDQRLARLFQEGKVKIEKLNSDQEWFHILTLHQNRVDRGHLNYIPEEVLPSFMDLIIWGHEHDCRIDPEWNGAKDFFVIQPGSSVATSLAMGESLPKHCGLLKINKTNFKLHPLKLETVRPFVFEEIILSEENLDPTTVNEHEQVQNFLKTRVLEALVKADLQKTGHPKQPQLPLIRLNVRFEKDSQQFIEKRFGQQFSDSVANPLELLNMKREKVRDRKYHKSNLDRDALDEFVTDADTEDVTVESLLENFYKDQPESKQLSMLSVKCLGEAVKSFTQKGYNEAIADVIDCQKKQYMEFLMKSNAETEEEVSVQISICKDELFSESSEGLKKVKTVLESAKPTKKDETIELIDSDVSDDEDMPLIRTVKESPEKTPRGRGRGRGGRGSRGGRGASSKTGNTSTTPALDITIESTNTRSSSRNNWLTDLSKNTPAKQPTRRNASRAKPLYSDD